MLSFRPKMHAHKLGAQCKRMQLNRNSRFWVCDGGSAERIITVRWCWFPVGVCVHAECCVGQMRNKAFLSASQITRIFKSVFVWLIDNWGILVLFFMSLLFICSRKQRAFSGPNDCERGREAEHHIHSVRVAIYRNKYKIKFMYWIHPLCDCVLYTQKWCNVRMQSKHGPIKSLNYDCTYTWFCVEHTHTFTENYAARH